jgi:hypothetical protein
VTTVHALAFGDADLWGAAWAPAELGPWPLALGVGGAGQTVEVELSAAQEPWRLEARGLSLVVAGEGEVARAVATDGELRSTDQLCRVSGTIDLETGPREVRSLGWRSTAEAPFESGRVGSLRQTAGWFEPPHGFALLALRPRRARGHEADLVVASMLAAEPAPAVSDPRLSTTYDAAGRPTRAGLELWVEPEQGPRAEEVEPPRAEEVEPPGSNEPGQPIARRPTAERSGPGIGWAQGELRLFATPLRWYSRGTLGSGVYLLGERG